MHRQLLFAQAPDHIEVEIGTDGDRHLLDECGRSEQAQLFTAPEAEDDVATAIGALTQLVCGAQDGGNARGVVVGAGVDLVSLAGIGERATATTATDVVVVRAEDDCTSVAFRRVGRHPPCDVPAGPCLALDLDVDRDLELGDGKAGDVRIPGVELFLDRGQRMVGMAFEDRVGDLRRCTDRNDPRAGRRRVEAHLDHLAGIRRVGAGDDDETDRAALARLHRFVTQPRVTRELRTDLLVDIFGEVAQNDDDLPVDLEAVVAVVLELGTARRLESVAGEDDAAFTSSLSENESAVISLPALWSVPSMTIEEPASFMPAVNSNGRRNESPVIGSSPKLFSSRSR